MPVFNHADQLYQIMRALFESMRNMNPNPVDALVSTHMVMRLNLSDPAAQITINARKRPVSIDYGVENGRVDLEIMMEADLLHQILLDEASIKDSLTNGKLKVRGPAWKTLSLAEIFRKGREYYPQVLQDQGLG